MEKGLIKVYEDRNLMDYIRDVSDRNLSRYANVEAIEWRAIKQVANYIQTPNGSIEHYNHVRRLINREYHESNRRKKELEVIKEVITDVGKIDSINLIKSDIDVEKDLELDELIKYLSGGDSFLYKMLKGVAMSGSLNISEEAKELSKLNGKSNEANRKALSRSLRRMRELYKQM